jgi:hypothetical protein
MYVYTLLTTPIYDDVTMCDNVFRRGLRVVHGYAITTAFLQ